MFEVLFFNKINNLFYYFFERMYSNIIMADNVLVLVLYHQYAKIFPDLFILYITEIMKYF